MNSHPQIGIVSLGEAGNFGDDLILVSVVQAIRAVAPAAEVRFLSHGQSLDWESLVRSLCLGSIPERVMGGLDLPGSTAHERLFADTDLVIFGGGGLLQTSHHPNRPYQWLNFLPSNDTSSKVLAVGLGLGPISAEWANLLRQLRTPFDVAYVRDSESLRIATVDLEWPATQCRDFVDAQFLLQFSQPAGEIPGRLGVALRAWPGLTPQSAAEHISKVAARHGVKQVDFFVLESKNGCGVDVDFSESVRELIKDIPTALYPYRGWELERFIELMVKCSVAVSMKLHSSALWAGRGIPIYPIVYAPKLAAFFGLPYSGLMVEDRIVQPITENDKTLRSADVVGLELPRMLATGQRSARGRITGRRRRGFQWQGLLSRVRPRLPFKRYQRGIAK